MVFCLFVFALKKKTCKVCTTGLTLFLFLEILKKVFLLGILTGSLFCRVISRKNQNLVIVMSM